MTKTSRLSRPAILLLSCFLFANNTWSQSGCTDQRATNFDPSATVNDGSCVYPATSITLTNAKDMPSEVHESSALIYTDGGLWTLNDSGNDPQIFQIDPDDGSIIKTIDVTNADNVDWEALSADDNYFYIGDFGNNKAGDRTDLTIYRVLKSDIGSDEEQDVSAEKIEFSYPDQVISGASPKNDTRFDCESMLIKDNKIHIFSKDWVQGHTQHYSLPTTPGTYVATKLDSFDSGGLITDASLSSGNQIVLLGYTTDLQHSFMWLLYDFTGENFFSGNKRRFELGSTLSLGQTEGVAFTSSGEGYVSNEEFGSIPPRIYSFSLESYIVLPIKLESFRATYINPDVRLDWQTSSEINNDYFSVQRSRDGKRFEEIGRQSSEIAENSGWKDYSYLDAAPLPGLNYYRLAQTDRDGAQTIFYSRVVNVPQAKAPLRVYASGSQLIIDAGRSFTQSRFYRLIDVNGYVLSRGTLTSSKQSIGISSLPRGAYYLRVGTQTARFVK